MNEIPPHGPASPLRSGLRLGLIAALCIATITAVRTVTSDRIAAEQARHARQTLLAVLGDRTFELKPQEDGTFRYRGKAQGRLSEVVATDGYNGPIHFWLGLDDDGTIRGARIIRHRETPGLTDDLNWPQSSWIESFSNIRITDDIRFDVAPHGGDFDAFSGATVTPRAIVRAVGRARTAHLGGTP